MVRRSRTPFGNGYVAMHTDPMLVMQAKAQPQTPNPKSARATESEGERVCEGEEGGTARRELSEGGRKGGRERPDSVSHVQRAAFKFRVSGLPGEPAVV